METAENNQQTIADDFKDEDKVTSDLKLWDYKDNKELIGISIEGVALDRLLDVDGKKYTYVFVGGSIGWKEFV